MLSVQVVDLLSRLAEMMRECDELESSGRLLAMAGEQCARTCQTLRAASV